MSTGAAAASPSCDRTTILRAIQRGELEAVRLGRTGDYRIPTDALAAWLSPPTTPRRPPDEIRSWHGRDRGRRRRVAGRVRPSESGRSSRAARRRSRASRWLSGRGGSRTNGTARSIASIRTPILPTRITTRRSTSTRPATRCSSSAHRRAATSSRRSGPRGQARRAARDAEAKQRRDETRRSAAT